jgi:hypothetical protein
MGNDGSNYPGEKQDVRANSSKRDTGYEANDKQANSNKSSQAIAA